MAESKHKEVFKASIIIKHDKANIVEYSSHMLAGNPTTEHSKEFQLPAALYLLDPRPSSEYERHPSLEH